MAQAVAVVAILVSRADLIDALFEDVVQVREHQPIVREPDPALGLPVADPCGGNPGREIPSAPHNE